MLTKISMLSLIALFFIAPPLYSASLEIRYQWNSLRICESASATLHGSLVGRASLDDLVKGSHYVVRETHYDPKTGAMIYEGVSKFAVYGGSKISERSISGQKKFEIFNTWPSH